MRFVRNAIGRYAALAAGCVATLCAAPPHVARAAEAPAWRTPAWLALRPGTLARVDTAPWPTFDEPEAALTHAARSLARDFSDDFARPDDIVYEPVGVRVRIVRVLPGARVALVRGLGAAWQAYAPVDRMLPEVPRGTVLRAAGGFAGSADFYPALDSPEPLPAGIATRATVVVLGMGAAPYSTQSADLVRVNVRVRSGSLRGRVGWIPVAYTGLPVTAVPAQAENAAKACVCRILRFEATP
jgi:hypothetical protein